MPEPAMPDEILKAETRRAQPAKLEGPSILGLPPIPADIGDLKLLVVKYGPWLLLVASILSGFNAVGAILFASGSGQAAANALFVPGMFLSFLAAVCGVFSFPMLVQKRRLGWELAASALGIHFFGSLLVTGATTILFACIELGVAAAVMLWIRDEFSE